MSSRNSTMMQPTILCAQLAQAALVSSVLTEAADWVASQGEALWRAEHVSLDAITADVSAGAYFIAWLDGEAAGVVRFQLEDPFFWPDAAQGEAVYLHRLAVRRKFAGGGISGALLEWGARRARELGRKYVRLDCAADRPSLRKVYERFGFQFHSERNMGRFTVARYQLAIAPEASLLSSAVTSNGILRFGEPRSGVNYVLRPGGYAVIQRDSGEIAIVSNPRGSHLPGGGQEPGETPVDAAVREAREECGLRIRIIKEIGMADQFVYSSEEATGWQKRCTFFLAEAEVEHCGAGEANHVLSWLEPQAAAGLLFHESQRWAVREAFHIR